MLSTRLLPLLIAFLAIPFLMNAQVTTSSIHRHSKNQHRCILSGSSVVLTHVPTGTLYKTSTNKNGKYDLVT
jgi:hypothetical protein